MMRFYSVVLALATMGFSANAYAADEFTDPDAGRTTSGKPANTNVQGNPDDLNAEGSRPKNVEGNPPEDIYGNKTGSDKK